MKDILFDIIAHKRVEVEKHKLQLPLDELKQQCVGLAEVPSMRASLAASPSGIIAEFKRRSPSKGWIQQQAKADLIPASYQNAGAAALSILTDEPFFGGTLSDIETAKAMVNLPILRKDFIIDEYQIYQARKVGASAILLIAAALSVEQCRTLAAKAHELGLEVLLEVHSEPELAHVNEFVDMVGVNNRNLGTFHTDIENSFRLAQKLPKDMLLVSESGISKPETLVELRKVGFRGFLIGETFMKTDSAGDCLKEFIDTFLEL